MIEFLDRRGIAIGEAIGRIGEIDRARARDREIVGAVEALAAIAIDEDRPALAREIDSGERAGAAVGDPQRTVRAEREAVRARLADQLRIDAGGACGAEEGRRAADGLPTPDQSGG